ncbi:phage head closure protein [Escherichia coli]|uniref:phage head closure protein n=1 Tax=Escherichia coli TaxID=562 RepID=UPI001F0F5FEC|nr:phage head closure protein [Escherichia coli]UMR98475.1 head-tail adaptor protein [Escherichia coli]UMR98826.1 head-tail adaptor protein [Escherichia coli]
MNFSALRHRITLQRRTGVQSPATGAMEYHWTDVATLWAQVVPVSVREFIAAQAVRNEITTRMVIRWREDISDRDRVLFRGKLYSIEGILPDPDSGREYLTLACSEGVKDG